jgi:hypothetical protein
MKPKECVTPRRGVMVVARWSNPTEEGQLWAPEPAKRSWGRRIEAMLWCWVRGK